MRVRFSATGKGHRSSGPVAVALVLVLSLSSVLAFCGSAGAVVPATVSRGAAHAVPAASVTYAWVNISRAPMPTAANCTTMAFDPGLGGVLCFGAAIDGGITQVWEFTHGTWTDISPGPSPWNCLAPAVYDASDGYDLLFCGQTWSFASGAWTNRTAAAPNASNTPNIPPTMTSPQIAYDNATGDVVLVEGLFPYRGPLPTYAWTWTYAHGVWSNVSATAGPLPNRVGGSLVFEPDLGGVALLGGTPGPQGAWLFRSGTWTNITTNQGTLETGSAVRAVYDEGLHAVLEVGPTGAAWTWNGTIATPLDTVTRPLPHELVPPLNESDMVYDAALNSTLLLSRPQPTSSNEVLPDILWRFLPAPPLPTVSSVSVSPATLSTGATFTLSVQSSGAGPLNYTYTGLPAPCRSENSSTLSCTPGVSGQFEVRATVSDPIGDQATGSTNVTVLIPLSGPSSGVPTWLVVVIVVGSFVAGGAVTWLLARRMSRRQGS